MSVGMVPQVPIRQRYLLRGGTQTEGRWAASRKNRAASAGVRRIFGICARRSDRRAW